MNKARFLDIKIFITGLIGWISNKMGIVSHILPVLIIMMISDQVSGVLAARKEGVDNSGNSDYGILSRKMRDGVYEKVGYILAITAAMASDYLIHNFSLYIGIQLGEKVNFGMLVTIWLTITELLSTIENIQRLGVSLPAFLKKILDEMRDNLGKEE